MADGLVAYRFCVPYQRGEPVGAFLDSLSPLRVQMNVSKPALDDSEPVSSFPSSGQENVPPLLSGWSQWFLICSWMPLVIPSPCSLLLVLDQVRMYGSEPDFPASRREDNVLSLFRRSQSLSERQRGPCSSSSCSSPVLDEQVRMYDSGPASSLSALIQESCSNLI